MSLAPLDRCTPYIGTAWAPAGKHEGGFQCRRYRDVRERAVAATRLGEPPRVEEREATRQDPSGPDATSKRPQNAPSNTTAKAPSRGTQPSDLGPKRGSRRSGPRTARGCGGEGFKEDWSGLDGAPIPSQPTTQTTPQSRERRGQADGGTRRDTANAPRTMHNVRATQRHDHDASHGRRGGPPDRLAELAYLSGRRRVGASKRPPTQGGAPRRPKSNTAHPHGARRGEPRDFPLSPYVMMPASRERSDFARQTRGSRLRLSSGFSPSRRRLASRWSSTASSSCAGLPPPRRWSADAGRRRRAGLLPRHRHMQDRTQGRSPRRGRRDRRRARARATPRLRRLDHPNDPQGQHQPDDHPRCRGLARETSP